MYISLYVDVSNANCIDICTSSKLYVALQNPPKALYVQKLFNFTYIDQADIDYTTVLCTRAKTFQGCPAGNLI